MPYSKIIITNSITPTAKPNPFDLSIGELTLNAADGKIFALNDSNEVVKLADKSYESRISNLETNPGVWGSIGGTLALQTDLTSALEAKVNNTDITDVILNTESVTGGARVDLTAVNGSTASFNIVTSGSGLSVTTANDIVTLTHVNVTRTDTTATQSGVFGDTINVITGVSSNQRGHVTGVETSTLTLPNVQSLENRLDALEYVPINITSFTVAPTTTIYEYSGNLYQPTFDWSTNTTPDTISLVSPYSVPSIGTGDTTYAEPIGEVQSYTTGAESSKSWTLSVTDSQNNTNSSTKTIKWVYPFYYGTDVADLSGGTGVETLSTKSVATKGNKTIAVVATNQFIYFTYPASYGNLTTILDGNGFNVTSSFTKHVANVSTSGNNVSYNIYKTNSVTTINQNFQYKF